MTLWKHTILPWLLIIILAKNVKGKCFCDPCGPIPGKQGFQFVGFTTSQDPSIYKLFDFSKLTTIVILGVNNQTKDFTCYAHARNVKVVLIAHPPTQILWRKKMRKVYIDEMVGKVVDNNLDGINIDYEESISRWFNPLNFYGLTSLVQEFQADLASRNPIYELSIDWVYCPNCQWGRSYNYNVIKNHVDYFLVMFYDMQWSRMNFLNGLCEPHSQNPFDVIKGWANVWVNGSGIPREKLVFAFPWYGHVHQCYDFESNSDTCFTKCGHINRAEYQRCYRDVLGVFNSGTVFSGPKWNDETKSRSISWISHDRYYRMNYDDADSLKLRYDMSYNLGVRGVGAWHITCLDFGHSEAAKANRLEMWGVLPTGRLIPT